MLQCIIVKDAILLTGAPIMTMTCGSNLMDVHLYSFFKWKMLFENQQKFHTQK